MKKKTLWILLSVVFIVAMAAGVLMMGREVNVVVDGNSTRVHTYALTVRQLLRQMGYKVTDADSVTPPASTWLSKVDTVTLERAQSVFLWVGPSGAVVELHSPAATPRQLLALAGIEPGEEDSIRINGTLYGMDDKLPSNKKVVMQYIPAVPISFTSGGETSVIRSSDPFVGKALWNNGVHLNGADLLSVPFTLSLLSAQEITLTRPTSLTIEVDGSTVKTLSTATTVGEALQALGITLQNLDYSDPSEDQPLPDDGKIRVIRVREEIVMEQTQLPYSVKYEGDNTLDLDTQRELVSGQYGIEVTRSIIHYENGVETSRETEETTTLVEPVDQVIAYGTNIVLNTIDTEYGTLSYYRKATVYVTSYSPCRSAPADGSSKCFNGTASGMPVEHGTIAVTTAWYSFLKGSQIYIPGYGIGTVGDTGGGFSDDRYWIDLAYSDADWVTWSSWVTVYFLAPAPSYVPGILP